MSMVNAKEILIKATEEKYAVGAFNISNLIQLEAIIEVHIDKKAPLIIQTSVTPSKFLGREVVVAIYRTLARSAPIPICLHLDHCRDIDYCRQCADAGYTNIMIDASKESYEENIRQTMEVVDYCHGLGDISVEGELGLIMGVEDQKEIADNEATLCDPEQAVDFVERTGVDLLAPAVGTVHGIYKTKSLKVDFERFAKIAQLINGREVRAPLVIHGGSGLPSDYVARLIELGGSKFNVSTDIKRTLIDTTYGYISKNRDEYNPGKIDLTVKDAIREKVSYWMDMLGSPGKA